MALNSLFCSDVLLRNYSLNHPYLNNEVAIVPSRRYSSHQHSGAIQYVVYTNSNVNNFSRRYDI